MPIIMAGENHEVPLSDIYMAKIRMKNDFKATPCTASIVTFYLALYSHVLCGRINRSFQGPSL